MYCPFIFRLVLIRLISCKPTGNKRYNRILRVEKSKKFSLSEHFLRPLLWLLYKINFCEYKMTFVWYGAEVMALLWVVCCLKRKCTSPLVSCKIYNYTKYIDAENFYHCVVKGSCQLILSMWWSNWAEWENERMSSEKSFSIKISMKEKHILPTKNPKNGWNSYSTQTRDLSAIVTTAALF